MTTGSQKSAAPTFTYSPTGPEGPGTGGTPYAAPTPPQAGLTPFGGTIPQTAGQSYFPQPAGPSTPASPALPPTSSLPMQNPNAGEGGQGGGSNAQGTAAGAGGFQAPAGAVGQNTGTTYGSLSQVPLIGGPAQSLATKVGSLLTSVFGPDTTANQAAAATESLTTDPISSANDLLSQAADALDKGNYQQAMSLAERADQLAGGVLGMTPGGTSVGEKAAVNPETGQAVGEADQPDQGAAPETGQGGATTDTGQLNTGDTAASGGGGMNTPDSGSPGGDTGGQGGGAPEGGGSGGGDTGNQGGDGGSGEPM